MKQSFRFLITFLLLGCYPFGLSAQMAGIEWLTTKQGLSQGFVSCLLQDKEGFIWVGTKNGVNRYDGYRFEVFTKDPYDEFTLSNDFITDLAEYEDFIIVGTEWGGINLIHKKTRKIYRLYCETATMKTPLDQCNVPWLDVDASGNIWAVVEAPKQSFPYSRMHKFSIPQAFWKNPPTHNEWQKNITLQAWDLDMLSMPYMCPDKKNILAASTKGILEIKTSSNEWKALAPAFGPEQLDNGTVFQSDEKGGVWIIRRLIDGRGEHLTNMYHYQPLLQKQKDPIQAYVLNAKKVTLQHIAKGIVWLNFWGEIKGYRLDNNGKFDINQPDIKGFKVPVGACSSMTDRSGIVWFGTNGLGIVKVNPRSNRFQNLFTGESVYSSILQSHKGEIVSVSNNFKLLAYPSSEPNGLAPQVEGLADISMVRDEAGVCWIAGRAGQGINWTWILKKINPDGTSRVFTMPYQEPNCLPMFIDPSGNPWFGLIGFLMHFDQKTEQFSKFDFRDKMPGPHNVLSLARTADGSWWLATRNGLLRAKSTGSSAENFEFDWLKNEPSNRNSLHNNSVASLLTDPNDPNILWVGTKGGGLDRLDVRTLEFKHLTTRQSLPDNVIYGVLAESGTAETILWLSSNKGLIRYNPVTGVIKNYTEEDGIQANEFNTFAYGKGPTGIMMFGGVNGMTIFHPQQLLEDTFAPRTLITRLRLNDRDISWNDSTGILTQGIEFTREIEVPFSRNNLTLEFVALHFASTGKNRFSYYLEGAEKGWSHESGEHSAAYLNLAPGTYTFKVIGSNSEGVWSTQPAELKITVLPPWYRSWWAWLLYVAVFGGGAYWFYRYQLRTKLEHAENERLKELDTFKSRFFTNITHEFRTPLTVILGITGQLKNYFSTRAEEQHNKGVEMIRRNGQNLLQLINQILDLAKLESGKLQMNLEKSDLIAFTKYMVESFHSFAAGKKIQMHFLAETESLEMDFDREKVQTILSNLLSNAVKFTPEGGHVYIHIGQIMADNQPFCQIKVRDTGIGIAEEKLGQVFDRFYQVDNSATRTGEGTGIGLALTRELVRLMRGEISVSSNTGTGATFSVTIPITTESKTSEGEMPLTPVAMASPKNPRPAPTFENPEKPLLLVVEDNDDVREYLIDCVSGQYQIAEAHNGQTGIEKAIELIPDLIVSDVMMPVKDGFELCQALKNDERTSHIPIVLLTARADASSRMEGFSRGADEYIAKPFDRQELGIRLSNLLANRRRLQARYASLPLPPASEDPELKLEDTFLLKIRDVVEAHLSDADFEMPQLERALGMSRSQIFRKVKALTNQSPTLFMRSVRLHKAKELLQNSKLSVAEVAYEVGFTTPSYFSTAFLEEFGKNPSDFR